MVATYADSQKQLTQESIFTAFLRLMEAKDFQEISVTEITRIAGVSRMAFYRNYANKEEIVLTYLDQLFQQFKNKIAKERIVDYYPLFLVYLEHIKVNAANLHLFLTNNLSDFIYARFQTYFIKIQKLLSDNIKDDDLCPLIHEYSAAGLFSVTRKWLATDCSGSVEKLALLLAQRASYNN